MDVEFIGDPEYTLARTSLSNDEQIVAEANAMASMSPNIHMQTSTKGGFMQSARRSVMGGESFFLNTFSVESGEHGFVDLAPGAQGDMVHIDLDGEMGVQSGCFVASAPSVELDASFSGFKGFFGGLGLTMLRMSGKGDLLLASFGAIMEKQVDGEYVVDSGHIVAFDRTLNFDVERVGGWGTTLLSGEGLVCRFNGEGTVYVQTRNVPGFAAWIHPFRPVESD